MTQNFLLVNDYRANYIMVLDIVSTEFFALTPVVVPQLRDCCNRLVDENSYKKVVQCLTACPVLTGKHILDPRILGDMNDYKRFVQNELDRRNWKPADATNHGGPSRQVMSNILNDDREVLVHRPKQETIEALATAFKIKPEVILAHVATAMGLPVSIQAASLEEVSDDDLLEQIRKRMNRESSEHATDTTTPPAPTPLHPGKDDHAEDAGLEQKIFDGPEHLDIAAHPDQELAADQIDRMYDQIGEENQDVEEDD